MLARRSLCYIRSHMLRRGISSIHLTNKTLRKQPAASEGRRGHVPAGATIQQAIKRSTLPGSKHGRKVWDCGRAVVFGMISQPLEVSQSASSSDEQIFQARQKWRQNSSNGDRSSGSAELENQFHVGGAVVSQSFHQSNLGISLPACSYCPSTLAG